MRTFVYVVTDNELGWDNIVGCFTSEEVANECAEDRNDGVVLTQCYI